MNPHEGPTRAVAIELGRNLWHWWLAPFKTLRDETPGRLRTLKRATRCILSGGVVAYNLHIKDGTLHITSGPGLVDTCRFESSEPVRAGAIHLAGPDLKASLGSDPVTEG